jgi:putative membrane protein
MKRLIATAAIAIAGLIGPAFAQTGRSQDVGGSARDQGHTAGARGMQDHGNAESAPLDRQFTDEAARQILASQQLGILASGKGTSPAINKLGARLNDVNADLQEELRKLAERQNLQLPNQMSDQAREDINRMKATTGEEFAQRFVPEILGRQERLVDLFQHQAQQGRDPEIRSFAERMLPRLEENLQTARQLAQSH